MGNFNFDYSGYVVLITGGTRGIGKAIAMKFADAGATVIINYKTNDKVAKNTKKIIENREGICRTWKADVTDPIAVKEMVDGIIKEYRQISILINNAATYQDKVVWKMSDDVWDDVIGSVLKGTFNCTREVAKVMRRFGWGRIINISSVVGQTGVFGTSNYSAAKAGLFGFTKAVAKELAIKNITVNCLTLGYFNTGMNTRLSKEIRAKTLEKIPLGRFGKLNEVTDFILFLSSNSSSYLIGQIIHLNGGYYM